ncbi:MAG: serine/threonine-protein kinase [Planctomycetota bacterium]
MPECPSRSELRRFVAGEMNAEEEIDVSAHVEGCTECQRLLAGFDTGLVPADWIAETTFEASRRLRSHLDHIKKWRPRGNEDHAGRFVGDLEPWLSLRVSDQGYPLIAEFTLQECLGRGGMGAVFLAVDGKLHRKVAIKLMSPSLLADPLSSTRFQREARASAAINHPNVVTVHAVGECRDLPYLVMEYVEGSPLSTKLKAGGMSQTERFEIARQIAEGLSAAHAAGIQHRDIKPGNILLQDASLTVKITDFGLARTLETEALTQSGLLIGTPEFMSPEQFDTSLGRIDHRSDLFSLGSVFYYLMSGQSPFAGDSMITTLQKVREAPHLQLTLLEEGVPNWFSSLVDGLLEKDPTKRVQSAAEVATCISAHRAHAQSAPVIEIKTAPRRNAAHDGTSERRAPRRSQRYASVWMLAGSILILLMTLGVGLASWKRPLSGGGQTVSNAALPSETGSRFSRPAHDGFPVDAPHEEEHVAMEVTDPAQLHDVLLESESELLIHLGPGEFELPSIELENRDVTLIGARRSDTRVVFALDDAEHAITAVDCHLELRELSVEFLWLDRAGYEMEDRSCILVDNGSFLAASCSFDCEAETLGLHFLESNAELNQCNVLFHPSIAFRWEPMRGNTLSLHNNVVASETQLQLAGDGDSSLHLEHNTFVGSSNLMMSGEMRRRRWRISAERNLFCASDAFCIVFDVHDVPESITAVAWEGVENRFPETILKLLGAEDMPAKTVPHLRDLSNQDWFEDVSSIQGIRPSDRDVLDRFESGDLNPMQVRLSNDFDNAGAFLE